MVYLVLGLWNAVCGLAVFASNTKEYITIRIILMKFFGIALVVPALWLSPTAGFLIQAARK
jgi:hypothetical protein